MARKRYQEPPEPIVKEFSPDEIDRGIEKLKRRITDVQALDPQKVRFDDPVVANVEHKMRETIREVFGPASPEFRDHEYHQIWQPYVIGETNSESQRNFAEGVQRTKDTHLSII